MDVLTKHMSFRYGVIERVRLDVAGDKHPLSHTCLTQRIAIEDHSSPTPSDNGKKELKKLGRSWTQLERTKTFCQELKREKGKKVSA